MNWTDKLKNIKLKNNVNLNNKLSKDVHYLPYKNIFLELDKYINKKISIYSNLKYSDGDKYINEKSKNLSFFFNAGKMNYLKNIQYVFFTINSINPFLSDNIIINSSERFNYITKKYIPYEKKYKINRDGDIIILLNNINGWFKKYWNYNNLLKSKDIVENLSLNIIILIYNIKKYNTKNKVLIRFHPKDRKSNIKKKIISNINKIYKNIEEDTSNSDNLLNSYCIFVQNSKIILELVSKGIPLFNHNLNNCNYFNNIYSKLNYISDLNKNIDKLPDRKKFLSYYYNYLLFIDEFEDNKEYVFNLLNKNIIN